MDSRGLAPAIGVVCLLVLTVGLAVAVGAATPLGTPSEPTVASFEVAVEPPGEIRISHRGGDAVDPGTLSLFVYVDGDPLEAQPPVPFFSAHGFESAPTGAFNSATTDHWQAGETATLQVARTNAPRLTPGATVTVQLYVDEYRVARLEATA